jgi:hypothetical protein
MIPTTISSVPNKIYDKPNPNVREPPTYQATKIMPTQAIFAQKPNVTEPRLPSPMPLPKQPSYGKPNVTELPRLPGLPPGYSGLIIPLPKQPPHVMPLPKQLPTYMKPIVTEPELPNPTQNVQRPMPPTYRRPILPLPNRDKITKSGEYVK